MNIIFEYPAWYLVFCVVLGGIFSFLLYRKNDRLNELPKSIVVLLSLLRFSLVTLLAVFLLSPMLKWFSYETENPKIALFVDNSKSILNNLKSNDKENLIKLLNTNNVNVAEIEKFTFGENVQIFDSLSFSEKETDFSKLFETLDVNYSNSNLGAVVIASDGLYNRGVSPLSDYNLKFPIYTIALGDTIPVLDVAISEIQNNRVAFLGNKFPVEIMIKGQKVKGKRSILKITNEKNNVVAEKEVIFNTDDDFQTFSFLIEAKEKGIKQYTVQIGDIENEKIIENNKRMFFVEVLDAKQKILILANAPHPDVSALKNGIESIEHYDVEVKMVSKLKSKLQKYGLVILHNLPSKENPINGILEQINSKNIPQLYIAGINTDYSKLSKLNLGIKINKITPRQNEYQATANNLFVDFDLTDETKNIISELPPLKSGFIDFEVSTSVKQLLNQKIGEIETQKGVLFFNEQNGLKKGILFGEGIWKWRNVSFAKNGSHSAVYELIRKSIQYLAVKEDKSKFRVFVENQFMENDPIVFNAELYNDLYELVQHQEVKLTIKNEQGNEFSYILNEKNSKYRYEINGMEPGNYSYNVTVQFAGKNYTKNGVFIVKPIQLEALDLVANHQLMYQLATKTGGKMYYPSELNELISELEQNSELKPVLYETKELKDLINLKWIFFLLLGLVSLEWFLRKREGLY